MHTFELCFRKEIVSPFKPSKNYPRYRSKRTCWRYKVMEINSETNKKNYNFLRFKTLEKVIALKLPTNKIKCLRTYFEKITLLFLVI